MPFVRLSCFFFSIFETLLVHPFISISFHFSPFSRLVWYDNRTSDIVDEIVAKVGSKDKFRDKTGKAG
jgi:hypothetical protein